MAYEPLHHKYRPQTFSDLVGQETIALTLSNALEQARIAPAYLFTGPRGTGKTSSARILAKSLNCLASDRPTPHPCGKCEACLSIAKGSALDVMEIDAASNTGVDNIREIIERSRFAPVQCRYKIYAIDECLAGDSLIHTSEGLMQIDNPNLKGKQVLSYNENQSRWEYKKVLRWLERGTKKTLTIKTGSCEIRCTENHLIRTETGWIKAGNVTEGMKILSPVNADVELPSINMERMADKEDSLEDINLEETNTEQNHIISTQFSNKQSQYSHYVNADARKNSTFPIFYKKKAEELKASNLIGSDILIKKVTDFGTNEVGTLSTLANNYNQSNGVLSMEPCLGMEALNIPTHTVDFPDYAGLTERNSKHGWSIKQLAYSNYVRKLESLLIKDTAKNQSFVTQLAILSYKKFMQSLSQVLKANQFLKVGFNLLLQKGWRGGTWMMDLSNLLQTVVPQYFFTQKDFPKKRIKLLLNGLRIWDILQIQNITSENLLEKNTTTSKWERNLAVNGYQTYSNTQSPQWNTNLEKVESVRHSGYEPVYDLEVEGNHNFVANGLLVHNCHMLSTAAFNALLKTLEEPPPQVVFILATTDPQRVLSTIISRCQRFDYRRIPLTEMTAHLRYIADTEQIAIADDALTLVAQISNGGLRDAESLLDQLSLLPETITVEKVWDLVGAVPEQDLLKLLHVINANDSIAVLQQCRSLLDRGREPLVVLQNLASFYLNLLIAKTAPQQTELTAVTETCWQQLCEEGKNWQTGLILRGQQHLKEAETQLKRTTQPRLWLEVTLLGLLPEVHTTVHTTIASHPQTVVPTSPQQVVTPLPTIVVTPPAPIANPQTASTQPVEVAAAPAPVSPPPQPESNPIAVQTESHSPQESVTQAPAAIAGQDPAANQQIWSQVVSCLQPPTTQALLKQQCYLVSFDDMSAIVGVSSAKLEKMAQQKIPNIEAAFARVCQRKVRVQLEVASAKKNSNTHSNVDRSVENSVKPSLQPPWAKPAAPSPPPPPDKPASPAVSPTADVITPVRSSEPGKPDNRQANTALAPQEVERNTAVTNPLPTAHHPLDNSPDNDVAIADPTHQPESALDENYSDSDLEQAIASLTQSFEGEVVQLNNDLDDFEDEEEDNEDAATLVEPNMGQNPDIAVSLERPDVEDYDDDW